MTAKKNPSEKRKAGRPGKYNEWLKPENLILIQGWKMDGLTDQELARNMGITQTTLIEWKYRFPEFSKALKMSAEIADRIVENALFKKAKEGNLGAQIFWLKNRKPDVWREEKASAEEKALMKAQTEKLRAEIDKIKLETGADLVDDGVTVIDDTREDDERNTDQRSDHTEIPEDF